MFYELNDEMVAIDPDDISDNFITVGFIGVDELENVAEKFKISQTTIRLCRENAEHFRCAAEVYDDYSFAILRVSDVKQTKKDDSCIGFFVKKNMLIIISIQDSDCSVRDKFLALTGRHSHQNLSLEKLIFTFMDSLIAEDNKTLEEMELDINRLEELVFHDRVGDDFNIQLLGLKKQLLFLRNYYEQLIDIAETLAENENEIFDKKDLRYFRIFKDKVKRLRESTDLLRDNVIHLRDTYSAYLDLRLNETTKFFTVITSIFLPLTVIVGWYGMNFSSMPEFNWKFGYLFVILLSVFVLVILYVVFKKKKWL